MDLSNLAIGIPARQIKAKDVIAFSKGSPLTVIRVEILHRGFPGEQIDVLFEGGMLKHFRPEEYVTLMLRRRSGSDMQVHQLETLELLQEVARVASGGAGVVSRNQLSGYLVALGERLIRERIYGMYDVLPKKGESEAA